MKKVLMFLFMILLVIPSIAQAREYDENDFTPKFITFAFTTYLESVVA